MTSVQTISRNKKQKALREIIDLAIDIIQGNKHFLDYLHLRTITNIKKQFEEWKQAGNSNYEI